VIYDIATKRMTDLGVNGSDCSFFQNERYVLYQAWNRLWVLELRTGLKREILRLDMDEMIGHAFSQALRPLQPTSCCVHILNTRACLTRNFLADPPSTILSRCESRSGLPPG
jgi:hypothetical protein